MTAKSQYLGHEIYHDGVVWRLSETDEVLHSPEYRSGGQIERCAHCLLPPTPEGHDGCLGALQDPYIQNACCGHNDSSYAYIQYTDGSDIRGEEAIREQQRLIKERENESKN